MGDNMLLPVALTHPQCQVQFYNEDPRLREQEWGNFQDPKVMEEVMQERRKIGAFYYRFPTGERCVAEPGCVLCLPAQTT